MIFERIKKMTDLNPNARGSKERYNNFKNHIEKTYTYISSSDIAKMNKDWGYPVMMRQCVQINKELFGE